MVKITLLDLLLVNAAFEGYKWPLTDNYFQRLKDRDISYESWLIYS